MRKQNTFVYFTESQKMRAVETDLAWFLPLHGYELEPAGSEKRLKSDKSITVDGNKWYNHSEERGGNPISLIQKLFNLDWKDAVTMLINEAGHQPVQQKEEREKEPFVVPPKNSSNQNVVNYLQQERKLDADIVTHFINTGALYQNQYGGAVFLGTDHLGTPKIATIRGTNPEKRFIKTETGSSRDYGFCHRGESNRLFVFESPIDMLSYITLHQKEWQEHSYLNLSGVASKAVVQFLKDTPNINDIVFCLDNDTAGINADERIETIVIQEFKDRKCKFSVEKPFTKDWNQDLKNWKSKSQSSIVQAKKMYELLREQQDSHYNNILYTVEQCHCFCENQEYDKAHETATKLLLLGSSTQPIQVLKGFIFGDDYTLEECENEIASLIKTLKADHMDTPIQEIQSKLATALFAYTIQIESEMELAQSLEPEPEEAMLMRC